MLEACRGSGVPRPTALAVLEDLDSGQSCSNMTAIQRRPNVLSPLDQLLHIEGRSRPMPIPIERAGRPRRGNRVMPIDSRRELVIASPHEQGSSRVHHRREEAGLGSSAPEPMDHDLAQDAGVDVMLKGGVQSGASVM